MEREKNRKYLYKKNISHRLPLLLWGRAVLAALFLGGMTGMYLCWIPLEIQERRILWLLVCLMPVICGLAGMIPRAGAYSGLVPLLAGVTAGGFFGVRTLFSGLLGVMNYLISWWNIRYEDGVGLFAADGISRRDLTGFSVVLFCFLAAIIWHWLQKERQWRLVFLCLIFLLPGLILNRFSAMAGAVALTACVGTFLACAEGGNGYQRTIWGLICTGLLLGFAAWSGEDQAVWADRVREQAAAAGEWIRYGEDTLPQGVLADAAGMLDGEEETLVVNINQVKRLYLRGFVGDRYENGRWLSLPKSAFGGEYAGMLDWLAQQGLEPSGQYVDYLEAGQEEMPEEGRILIKNTGAYRKYRYLPYSVRTLGGVRRVQDHRFGGAGLLGVREYSFEEFSDGQPSELLYLSDWFLQPENEEQEQYIRAESVYRGFVYEHYTEVSDEAADLVNRLFVRGAEPETKGIYHVTQRIREVLSERVTYRSHPDHVPEGEEPMRWFLLEGREGNAAMFASVAVEVYRAFGIPARYTEGYLLTEEQCASSNGNVHLTNRDSHAWAEVYMDGVGWLPVDVTPGFYFDTYTLMEMLEHPKDVQSTAALEDGEHGADEVQGEKNTEGKLQPEPLTGKVLWQFTGFLLAALCLVVSAGIFILTLRRCFYSLYVPHRFRNMKPEERVQALYRIIALLLEKYGIQAYIGWNAEETERKLRDKFPAFGAGEYLRVNDLMEKYSYGDGALLLHEERTLACFARKLYREGKGKGRRHEHNRMHRRQQRNDV